MRVTEVKTYEDFISLKTDWERLLGRCSHNFFSTWEWLSTWWKYYGEKRRLLILLAEEGDEIIGIAPFMYSVESMFGLRLGKIAFIGTPHSDYSDIISAGRTEECIKLFVDYLKLIPESWGCIELNDVPENSKSLSILNELSTNIRLIHPCPYVSLPESHEEFTRGPDGKRKYTDINRHFKSLQKSYEVEVTDCSKLASYEEGMHWLFKLHQRRWTSRGLSGAFASSRFRNFHLAIAKTLAEKGWLGLFLLKLSGNPVAALYGFRYYSKYYLYLTGFNPEYAKYGVGSLLISSVIHRCIDEGLSEFDFLRGDEAYKTRWASSTRWNRQVVITEANSLAKARYWVSRKYWNRGKELKALLKIQ
jgi:CelD/BcsL family acetyltransferase involved in cellulose biosynthesis